MSNIGRLIQSILAQERIGKAKDEREQERYARIVIPLDRAEYVGTDIEIHVKGDYIGRIKYDGSATGCYFKLNNRHSGRIYAGEFRRTYSEYNRIYLTNPSSQSGKQLILTVGGAFSSEIEPSSGGKTGLQDTSGTDIDPAIKGEYTSILAAIDTSNDTVLAAIEADTGSIDTNLFDSSTDKIKNYFGGNVFNMAITAAMVTDDAKHAFAASAKKLKDVVIKNTHATENLVIGENQSDVATMRSTDFILKAGASIGFTQVDLHTLYYCTETNTEEPTARLIGVEE